MNQAAEGPLADRCDTLRFTFTSNDIKQCIDSTGTETRSSNSWTDMGLISPSSGAAHYRRHRSWLMQHHSSANPWLDFLPFPEAQTLAQQLNADLEAYCATGPVPSIRRAVKTALRVRPLATRARCSCRILTRSSHTTRKPTPTHPRRDHRYARGWFRAR
jgi:hypothetical protein